MGVTVSHPTLRLEDGFSYWFGFALQFCGIGDTDVRFSLVLKQERGLGAWKTKYDSSWWLLLVPTPAEKKVNQFIHIGIFIGCIIIN
jgi:hypothetical protein